jgi:uncharacterized delta-60 repeat protein
MRRPSRRTARLALLAAAPSLLSLQLMAGSAHAAVPDGVIDRTYDGDGVVSVAVGAGPFTAADEAVLLADGRLLVAGTANGRFVVARLSRTGALDTTFGGGDGIAEADPDSGVETLQDIAVQANGKILLGGESVLSGGLSRVVVSRLTAAGNLDPTFGNGGTAVADVSPAGSERGGKLALVPGATPTADAAVLVGGFDETPLVSVIRLTPAGGTDIGFGTLGRVTVDLGARAVLQDLERRGDGRIYLSGTVQDGAVVAGQALDRLFVAALTSTGVPDRSFAGDGTFAHSPSSGRFSENAPALTLTADGGVVVAGASGGSGALTHVSPTGALLSSSRRQDAFGDGGAASYATSRFDAVGRLLVAGSGTTATTRFGVGRAVDAGGVLDTAFGGTRAGQAPECRTGRAAALELETSGRVYAVGDCDGRLTVVRYLADNGNGAVLANLTLTAAPSDRSVQLLALPISTLDRRQIMPSPESLQSSPLNSTFGLASSLSSAPLNSTFTLASSPLNSTFLVSSPLNSTSLPATTLADYPLFDVPGGWAYVLEGTPLAGLPLQSITLQQVLALDPLPARVAELTLAHLPLNSTPLNSTSLAALLLGRTPLAGLPAPAGGWCAFLADQPYSCTSGVDLDTTTLAELETRGDDLTGYYLAPIRLADVTLAEGATVSSLLLTQTELAVTPLGDLTYAQAPSLFACPAEGCAASLTLAQAQASPGAPDPATGKDVGDVLGLGVLPDLTLGQLIPGILPADDFPYEAIPLEQLLALAPEDGDQVTYTAGFDLDCTRSEGLTVTLDLPDTAELVAGSATVDYGSGSAPAVVTTDEPGRVVLSLAPDGSACTNPTTGKAATTVRLVTVVPIELGVSDATVDVTTIFDPTGLSAAGATVRTTDPTEPANDTPETAPEVVRDTLYSGHIDRAGDVDWLQFRAPAAGSVVTVHLSHLAADLDAYAFAKTSGDVRNAPLNSTFTVSAPLNSTIVEDSTGVSYGYDGSALATDTLQDSPLNSTFAELVSAPLNSTPLNSTLISLGAKRGTSNELLRFEISEAAAGQLLPVAIAGYNGANSPQPYIVRIKVDESARQLPCVTRAFPNPGSAGTLPAVASTTQTLFLVNKQRFEQVYGATATSSMLSALGSVANRAEVQGVVVQVEADADVAAAYRRWDGLDGGAGPCSVQAANDVVAAVNGLVDDLVRPLAGLRHIVLVGSDLMLPATRVADRTSLSNQRDYAREVAFAGRDNAISRAFLEGYVLTDDAYGDFDPMAWLGGKLYVPDVGLGRLVETPAEITLQLQRYLDPEIDGRIQLGTSYVAGYDFLADSATAIADTLAARSQQATHRRDIREDWTAGDAKAGLATDARTISINAHYDHRRALPARENADPGVPNPALLTSADLAATSMTPGGLFFTVGCQAGLNVADVAVTMPGSSLSPADAKRVEDWAQTAGAKGLAFLGNTGYGYGDTRVVGYSERLFVDFTAALDGTATVGQALALAKNKYIATGGPLSVYDSKVTQEATFYGLPFLRVGAAGTTGPALLPGAAAGEPADVTLSSSSFDVRPDLRRVTTDRGSYYAVGTEAPLTTQLRPVTARTTIDVTPADDLAVRSAWFLSVQTKDLADQDPVYSIPSVNAARNEPEPRVRDVAWPAMLATTSRQRTPGGVKSSLTLLPNQFFTEEEFGLGNGVQRLFTRLSGQVYRSNSTDFVAPQIARTQAFVANGTAVFRATIPSADTAEVAVHYLDDATEAQPDGSLVWRTAFLTTAGDGTWVGTGALSAGATEVKQYFLQARDRAGNVGYNNNKARYFRSTAGFADRITFSITPGADASGYYTSPPTVAITPQVDGVDVEYSVDGGAWTRYEAPFLVSGDGGHTVAVRGSDGSSGLAGFVIDTLAPTSTISTPAAGAVFDVGQEVDAVFSCADAGSGVRSCEALDPVRLNTAEGTHTFRVKAVDRLGREAITTTTYRAGRYTFEGFFAPVDNPPVLNTAKAGSAIPVQFRVLLDGVVQTSKTVVRSITSTPIACPAGAPTDEIETNFNNTDDDGWSYPGQVDNKLFYNPYGKKFLYVYKSSTTWRGCYRLTVKLSDGVTRHADFLFRA